MWRTGWAGLVLAGVLVGGSGCRTCDDRPGLFSRLLGRDRRVGCDPCASGYPAALGRPVGADAIGAPGYPVGWSGDFGPGYPVYPAGQPVPAPAAGVRPANELPYPTIPSPGVPEGTARPTPAIPGATGPATGARVTSDPKK